MDVLSILQIIISSLLIVSILMQQRSAGNSSFMGGSGGDGAYFKKRGAEKFLFWGSVCLSVLFFCVSIISFVI